MKKLRRSRIFLEIQFPKIKKLRRSRIFIEIQFPKIKKLWRSKIFIEIAIPKDEKASEKQNIYRKSNYQRLKSSSGATYL